MKPIKEYLASATNYTKGRTQKIEYIVVHFTANDGDTAYGNCNYFCGSHRNASAHYFVDENNIYQSVLDNNTAWHCGAITYRHDKCRNGNSIGIEMCSRMNSMGEYYITNDVVENTIDLVKHLMEKYNIPIENVIRHYDVTGKFCPKPFVDNETLWIAFKDKVVEVENDVVEIRYNTVEELPEWAVSTIEKLIDQGTFADENNLDLSIDMIRIFVFHDRMGLYDGI